MKTDFIVPIFFYVLLPITLSASTQPNRLSVFALANNLSASTPPNKQIRRVRFADETSTQSMPPNAPDNQLQPSPPLSPIEKPTSPNQQTEQPSTITPQRQQNRCCIATTLCAGISLCLGIGALLMYSNMLDHQRTE